MFLTTYIESQLTSEKFKGVDFIPENRGNSYGPYAEAERAKEKEHEAVDCSTQQHGWKTKQSSQNENVNGKGKKNGKRKRKRRKLEENRRKIGKHNNFSRIYLRFIFVFVIFCLFYLRRKHFCCVSLIKLIMFIIINSLVDKVTWKN